MVLLRGAELKLHEFGEALSEHIRRENDYFEAEILDYIQGNFPVHGTIVDIGANIGNHSLYFARYLKYRQILAFEPVPDNYILLVSNVARYNGFYPFKFAISNQEKLIHLRPNRTNMGASEVIENPESSDVEVIALPLDRFSLYDVTLMKIDVEWHEPQVLQGAYTTIEKNKPLILIEDSNKEYEKLLPHYECIMAWDHHKTYLYKWRGT